MTERLYYNDPYKREFDAIVTRVQPHKSGQAVRLDQSAFYPTSGGQSFDLGTLAGGRVIDVSADDGDVMHVVQGGEAIREGDRVHGIIDWARRFDHMQQHTGQHILSAAIVRCTNVPSVAVHLGADVSTVDLSRELTTAEIAQAEDAANRVVWENRPIEIRYVEADAAGDLPLRKAPKRDGTLRLIEIHDWDLSACGGTHVAATGAVGVIVVSAWERFKGGQRLTFLCGGRAVRAFRQLRDITTASSRQLSTTVDGVPAGLERLQTELRDQGRMVSALEKEVAASRAATLREQAETVPGGRAVVAVVSGSASMLKDLASAICAEPGYIAVLLSDEQPSRIVCMRSAGMMTSCHAIVSALTVTFGGRGGGKPDLAQGGGLDAAPERLIEEVRRLLAASA